MKKGTLYLIPVLLGDEPRANTISPEVGDVINTLDEFIVEDARSARRSLKKMGYKKSLDELKLHLLNEHTDPKIISTYLISLDKGKCIGLLSDAGSPCIVDPGADVVKLAHKKSISVVPLVGPSSVLLALIASGLNGQQFVFHGYLPKEQQDRVIKLKEIEREFKNPILFRKQAQIKNAGSYAPTHIFIETPYRNLNLFKDITDNLSKELLLCIACDITLPTEFIQTKSIGDWKKKMPEINKKPAVFLLGI